MNTFRVKRFPLLVCFAVVGFMSHIVIAQQKSVELSDYTNIIVEGTFNIYLVYAETPRVVISGQQEMLDKIEVKQTGNEVKVFNKKKFKRYLSNHKIKAVFFGKHFKKINLSGGNQLKSEETLKENSLAIVTNGSSGIQLSLEVNHLKVKTNGSGDIDLSGESGNTSFSINGSGEVKANHLRVKDASIKINGSGDINLKINGDLDITINGSGNVNYSGKSNNVNIKIHGSGNVTKKKKVSSNRDEGLL